MKTGRFVAFAPQDATPEEMLLRIHNFLLQHITPALLSNRKLRVQLHPQRPDPNGGIRLILDVLLATLDEARVGETVRPDAMWHQPGSSPVKIEMGRTYELLYDPDLLSPKEVIGWIRRN